MAGKFRAFALCLESESRNVFEPFLESESESDIPDPEWIGIVLQLQL